MKKLFVLLFFIPLFTKAQTTHTVAPKETLYSLARKYNVAPKDLAAYNNIPVETGLTIGQVIKIPAKGTVQPMPKTVPPKQDDVIVHGEPEMKKATSGSIPIYHKVEKKETLYHISKLYPGITIDDIKKWNNLTTDGLTEGTNLIVGYKNDQKADAVVSSPVKEVKSVVVTETPKKDPVVIPETKPVPSKTMEPVKSAPVATTGKNANGGYFKSVYEAQLSNNKSIKEETGTAAIFKSASGWEDGKYYCLHNTAPAGSIVKIINKSNQRSVYAKVLDVIPDLKQNAGILIRLSNAAADELGTGESNFEAILNY
jgi:LysM repeat protein